MSGRLGGKVAVVTGGGNGIGRATVLRFLAEGAKVVVADLNEATGHETVSLAAHAGHAASVRFVRTDVSVEDDVEEAVATATREFGGLDCMFNNAGIAGAFGPITHLDAADWDHTQAVLLRGVFLGMKHAARVMRAQGRGGSILSTASIAGLTGGDGPQAYSAAKAAVINLTRAVSIELAPDRVRVNAICPGAILTPLLHRGNPDALRPMLEKYQPWPDAGRPEDIAAAALFLASDDGVFVTGASLVVDGGATARGGNAIEIIGGGPLSQTIVGMDHGTTGRNPTLRPVS
ncbi:glucose 1-dehydrogenase [bacterium]|nr:glucose 1-dehydrogenase [bacterium]